MCLNAVRHSLRCAPSSLSQKQHCSQDCKSYKRRKLNNCGVVFFFHSNIDAVAFSPLREFCVMLLNFNLFRYLMSPFRWKILRLLEAVSLFFFLNGKSFCARLQSQSLFCLLSSHVSPVLLLSPSERMHVHWCVWMKKSAISVCICKTRTTEKLYITLHRKRHYFTSAFCNLLPWGSKWSPVWLNVMHRLHNDKIFIQNSSSSFWSLT